ncbi:MAG: DNA polymerase III subunit alpha, partial [Deltaproteobacteria bacterium]
KGVGEAAIRALVDERNAHGPFRDFEDLVLRAPDRVLNKRILEALIRAGALDGLIPERHAALEGLGRALELLGGRRRRYAMGQAALFGEAAEPDSSALFPEVPPWSPGECLHAEREALGFYLSGHPLEARLAGVDGLGTAHLGRVAEMPDGAEGIFPVCVTGVRRHQGKSGAMAFARVEDMHAGCDLIVFASLYSECAELLAREEPLLVAARVDRSRGEPALIAEAVAAVDELLPELVREITIEASSIAWDEVTLARLKSLASGGPACLRFHVRLPDGSLARLRTEPCIRWSEELRVQLEARFGADAIRLACRPWRPERAAGARRGGRPGG